MFAAFGRESGRPAVSAGRPLFLQAAFLERECFRRRGNRADRGGTTAPISRIGQKTVLIVGNRALRRKIVHSNSPKRFTYRYFASVTSAMYAATAAARKTKYRAGGALSPMTSPSGVNGMIVSTAIPAEVSAVTCRDARLFTKGEVCSLTILGSVEREKLCLRSGAKTGDLLYATGVFGNSFHSGHHLEFRPRLEEARFLQLHVFVYSRRAGTPAGRRSRCTPRQQPSQRLSTPGPGGAGRG